MEVSRIFIQTLYSFKRMIVVLCKCAPPKFLGCYTNKLFPKMISKRKACGIIRLLTLYATKRALLHTVSSNTCASSHPGTKISWTHRIDAAAKIDITKIRFDFATGIAMHDPWYYAGISMSPAPPSRTCPPTMGLALA